MAPESDGKEVDLETLLWRLRSGLKLQMEVTRGLIRDSRQMLETAKRLCAVAVTSPVITRPAPAKRS